jgi:hypothetical protein
VLRTEKTTTFLVLTELNRVMPYAIGVHTTNTTIRALTEMIALFRKYRKKFPVDIAVL